VLDFSNASFSDFFASELKISIDERKYSINGGSKGKHLRCFLQSCDDATAVRAIAAPWEHRSEYLARTGGNDPVVNAGSRYHALIKRLSGGVRPQPAEPSPTASVADRQTFAKIKADLLQIGALSPQERGFAFEGFLKSFFDAFGLAARTLPPAPRADRRQFSAWQRHRSARGKTAWTADRGRRAPRLSWKDRAEGGLDARPIRQQ
jgi:hypothetical protein